MATDTAPKTLREAILFFADYENCRKAVEAIRWPDGVVRCPTCGSERLRLALQSEHGGKMDGTIEADETFIGGKARNKHAAKKRRIMMKGGRSIAGEVAIMALLERHDKPNSQVRLHVLHSLREREVQAIGGANVKAGAKLHTDSFHSYSGFIGDFAHKVIDHAETYVDGEVHTNNCENFWAPLEARHSRHLRVRRTVPSAPLPR